jgi:hypothetical protein
MRSRIARTARHAMPRAFGAAWQASIFRAARSPRAHAAAAADVDCPRPIPSGFPRLETAGPTPEAAPGPRSPPQRSERANARVRRDRVDCGAGADPARADRRRGARCDHPR